METNIGLVTSFIRNGLSINQQGSNQSGLPITRIETISNEEIDIERVGFANIADTDYNEWLLSKGDILFSHINSEQHLGKTAIYEEYPEKIIHGMNLLCIRVDKNLIIPKYLFYFLKYYRTMKLFTRIAKRAVNQASISINDIKNIKISVPPISEQIQIIEFLNEAVRIQKLRKEIDEKLGEIVPSLFYEMFGDPIINSKRFNLNNLGFESQINAKRIKSINDETEVTFLPMADVDERLGQIKGSQIKPMRLVKKGFTYFEENDILFAKITPCMENGKAVIAKNLANGVGYGSTEFHTIRCGVNLLPEYVWGLVRLKEFRNYAKTYFSGTAGQQRVPTNFLLNYKIPIPPIEDQTKFAKIIKQVYSVIPNSESSLKKLELLYETILTKAFDGSLTASWREAHMKELLQEMEEQKKYLKKLK